MVEWVTVIGLCASIVILVCMAVRNVHLDNEIERLREGLRRILEKERAAMIRDAVEGLAWQLIETAPHDGTTWILGYESGTGETGILIWDGNPEEKYPDEHPDVWSDGYRVWEPTHWMHQPEPPEEATIDLNPMNL